MFPVSYAFLQTGKGGILWRHISERLRKEADKANRAQVFTTPGSVTAWRYQNSSVPSAGRLPLPLPLYSGLGEKLPTAGGWVTSHLAEAVSGCLAPKAGFLFALGYLHIQETLANNLLLPIPLSSLSHYFPAISRAGIYKLLHDWDWCGCGGRGKRQ